MSPAFWHNINALEHMNVHILVTVNNSNLAELSTLVFKTLRTGFPTAKVNVYANGDKAEAVLEASNVHYYWTPYHDDGGRGWHHANWIKRIVTEATEPTVILDSDVIFWDDVQSALAALPAGPVLHGRHIPRIWNEWSGCPSVPRLHTSLLYIPDPAALRTALRNAYPRAYEPLGEYCPAEPWYPSVRFDMGTPTFWDTAAGAYNMLPGLCRPFGADLLDRYTHVNSPTFYDVFVNRMADPGAYNNVLNLALTEPDRLRGFWRSEDLYYNDMHNRLLAKEGK